MVFLPGINLLKVQHLHHIILIFVNKMTYSHTYSSTKANKSRISFTKLWHKQQRLCTYNLISTRQAKSDSSNFSIQNSCRQAFFFIFHNAPTVICKQNQQHLFSSFHTCKHIHVHPQQHTNRPRITDFTQIGLEWLYTNLNTKNIQKSV